MISKQRYQPDKPYPTDKCQVNQLRYRVDSDLYSGYRYPPFEQLGPDERVFCDLFKAYSVKTMILLQKQKELAQGRDSNRLSKLMGCKQCFPIMRQLYKEARNCRLRFCPLLRFVLTPNLSLQLWTNIFYQTFPFGKHLVICKYLKTLKAIKNSRGKVKNK